MQPRPRDILLVLALAASAAFAPFSAQPHEWGYAKTSACFEVQLFGWGLGSAINTMLHIITDMRTRQNYTTFYVDASRSPYQCVESSSARDGLWYFFDRAKVSQDTFLGPGSAPAACDRPFRVDGMLVMLGNYSQTLQAQYGAHTHNTNQYDCKSRATGPEEDAKRQALFKGFYAEHCKTVREFWHPTPRMQAILDYELGLLRTLPRPLVGVHVRGGDKLVREVKGNEYRNFELGLGKVKAANPAVVNGTVFLVGDDHLLAKSVASQIIKAFGSAITLVSKMAPHAPHVQDDFNKSPLEHRCPKTQAALIDMMLLAAAEHHIGMVHSNVDALAAIVAHCVHNRTLEAFVDASRDCDPPFFVGF